MSSSSEEPQQTQDIVSEDFIHQGTQKDKKRKREKDSSEDSAQSDKKKRRAKRRKIDRSRKGEIFISVNMDRLEEMQSLGENLMIGEDLGKIRDQLLGIFEDPAANLRIYDGERIRVIPTPEERDAEKKAYRTAYRQLPEVKKKRTEKTKSEEEIEKRARYQKDPRVKQRKKDLAKVKRRELKEMKKRCPKEFAQVEREVLMDVNLPLPSLRGKSSGWTRKEAWKASNDIKLSQDTKA